MGEVAPILLNQIIHEPPNQIIYKMGEVAPILLNQIIYELPNHIIYKLGSHRSYHMHARPW